MRAAASFQRSSLSTVARQRSLDAAAAAEAETMAAIETRVGDSLAKLRQAFLPFTKDRFNCVTVDLQPLDSASIPPDLLPILLEALPPILHEAAKEWQLQHVRGVWAHVPLHLSSFNAILAERDFEYHHVEKGNCAVLTAWLNKEQPNNLPQYADHSLGVAGLVIHEEKILCIQERYYPIVNGEAYWKLPGGLSERGEELSETAVRETREETGVTAEFECLLSLRHLHNFRWGISDFYAICLLRLPDRPNAAMINFDRAEIADCRWMDLAEFSSRNNLSPVLLHALECYRNFKRTGQAIFSHQVPILPGRPPSLVYSSLPNDRAAL